MEWMNWYFIESQHSNEGDVYPRTLPNGETEYCVSGSCNACDSKWRDDLVNDWKEEVCCRERGMEPNRNNGSCQEPKTPGIGMGYSKITAFPGCSSTPAGKGENNYCKPPPSSSSSPPESSSSDSEPSSSSYNEPSSSSEQQEDAECYANDLEANAAYDGKIWRCIQAGNIPNFRLDGRRCITGGCEERSSSSSSSDGASSSSSGDGGVCYAGSKQFLQKPGDYYDDWVYMGKESYGSRKSSRRLPTLGIKYFDALGRIYEEIMGRKMYYTREPLVEVYEIPLEFEVYGRIIKDSEGNDIQVFVKEDKARGLRRDSSFYWDGSWEVFEFDDLAKETRFRTSSGIRSLRRYDDVGHLKERNMIDSNGDTLTSEQYEWKNGRLIRMTANGVVRNYIYGKTLQDTIYVEPSDEGFNYHSGYNGTAGKIPEEGTFEYKFFAMEPYGHAYSSKKKENKLLDTNFALKKTSSSLNILKKIEMQGCVKEVEKDDMPEPQCVRLQEKDIFINHITMEYGYPSSNGQPVYGYSDFELSLDFWCECNKFGRYQSYFIASTFNERIEINQSFWKYDFSKKYWHEHCWRKEDLWDTYKHETRHIGNARTTADNIQKGILPFTYDTKEKCEKYLGEEEKIARVKWNVWYDNERKHKNENPKSPQYGGIRLYNVCN